MRTKLVLSLIGLAVLGAGAADASGPAIGTYKGHATNGTTSPSGGKSVAFIVKTLDQCPQSHSRFGRSLCLEFTPGLSMPVTCHSFNSADPTPRLTMERRSVPSEAAVSPKGRVDYTYSNLGPGVTHNSTRLVVTISGGKATGYATYSFHGRSVVISSDCTGRLDFSAKHK